MERIGVFLCSCSDNISNIIDFGKLKTFIFSLPSIVSVEIHKLLCSEEGKNFLKQKINENKFSRVLIAGCSPKLYEPTFMKIMEDSGLNPYLLSIANIREHCAYVTEDRDEALEKAKKIVQAAYRRLLLQEPLEKIDMEINPDVVILGGGIAGIEAAILLKQKNRNIFLIEKNPNIGGMVTRQEELFPNMECATCLLDPLMDEILHSTNVKLYTLSELKEVKGFAGNFEIKIKKYPRYVDETKCFGCGLCFDVCPVEIENEYNEKLNKRKAIYIPYQGCLPFVTAIDPKNCLNFKGEKCDKCINVCSANAIDFNQKEEEIILKAGAIVVATGHSNFNKEKFCEGNHRIYSSAEFERLISQTGPTAGEIKLSDGSIPKTFAIIYCVGSRSQKFNEYCSNVCCMAALKYGKIIKSKIADAKVFHIYKDLNLPDKYDFGFFNEVFEQGYFIRVDDIENLKLKPMQRKVKIKLSKPKKGKSLKVDMVILMTAIEKGESNEEIKNILDISTDKYGFLKESHNRINPSNSEIKGIYVAGTVSGPKDISQSIMQAGLASANILSSLIPGERIQLEPITSVIDKNLCSGCKTCIVLCPYKAINFDEEKKVSVIQEVLCQGCGTCVAACPSGAAYAKHFKDSQILAEIKEVI